MRFPTPLPLPLPPKIVEPKFSPPAVMPPPAAPVEPMRARTSAPRVEFETLIGRNAASWIGGIVLLLGICFFLKYAWDRGWIRPSRQARVAAAVMLGIGTCALGEWVCRK